MQFLTTLSCDNIRLNEAPHRIETNKVAYAPINDSDEPGRLPSLSRAIAVRLLEIKAFFMHTAKILINAESDLCLRLEKAIHFKFLMVRPFYLLRWVEGCDLH